MTARAQKSTLRSFPLLVGALAASFLTGCSSAPFGAPDNPSDTIQPARPSPFEENVSGGNASPWANNGVDVSSSSSR